MKKRVITISGKARAGKDTVAEILVSELPNSVHINYADWLKTLAVRLYGYDEQEKQKYRSKLQYLGTEMARTYNPDYWVDTVMGAFDMLKDYDTLVIGDARFPNEIQPKNWIDKFEFINILVKREDENGLTEEQKGHASENALNGIPDDSYDIIVFNYGYLEELGADVRQIIDDYPLK